MPLSDFVQAPQDPSFFWNGLALIETETSHIFLRSTPIDFFVEGDVRIITRVIRTVW